MKITIPYTFVTPIITLFMRHRNRDYVAVGKAVQVRLFGNVWLVAKEFPTYGKAAMVTDILNRSIRKVPEGL